MKGETAPSSPAEKTAASAARWEFRCWFASGLEPTFPELETWSRLLPEERADIYLPAANSSLLVKLRDGEALDVKALQAVEDGLELWLPSLQFGFPASTDELAALVDLLEVGSVLPHPAVRSPGHFLAALMRRSAAKPRLVEKHRTRFKRSSCTAEICAISFDGRHATTLCIESECASTVSEFRRKMKLEARANLNYGAFLRLHSSS